MSLEQVLVRTGPPRRFSLEQVLVTPMDAGRSSLEQVLVTAPEFSLEQVLVRPMLQPSPWSGSTCWTMGTEDLRMPPSNSARA